MRIAFTGAQGTGKTTLIKALSNYLPNYIINEELVRSLVKTSKVKINKEADDASQNIITTEHLRTAVESYYSNKNVIFDRCVLDSFVYAKESYNHNLISKSCVEYAASVIDIINKYYPYDIVIYIPPKLDLVEDGVRDTNIEYRDNIDSIFREVITWHKCNHVLTSVKLSDRINEVVNIVNEKIKTKELQHG
jgi:nicotinamide riboside kinase